MSLQHINWTPCNGCPVLFKVEIIKLNFENMFNVGDRVKIRIPCSGNIRGEEYVIRLNKDNNLIAGECTCQNYWELINKIKQPTMKNLNNMMKKLLDADTQALVKTEYINGDLELTSKAKEALFSMLYTDKKAELVALAKQEILEAKEEK